MPFVESPFEFHRVYSNSYWMSFSEVMNWANIVVCSITVIINILLFRRELWIQKTHPDTVVFKKSVHFWAFVGIVCYTLSGIFQLCMYFFDISEFLCDLWWAGTDLVYLWGKSCVYMFQILLLRFTFVSKHANEKYGYSQILFHLLISFIIIAGLSVFYVIYLAIDISYFNTNDQNTFDNVNCLLDEKHTGFVPLGISFILYDTFMTILIIFLYSFKICQLAKLSKQKMTHNPQRHLYFPLCTDAF